MTHRTHFYFSDLRWAQNSSTCFAIKPWKLELILRWLIFYSLGGETNLKLGIKWDPEELLSNITMIVHIVFVLLHRKWRKHTNHWRPCSFFLSYVFQVHFGANTQAHTNRSSVLFPIWQKRPVCRGRMFEFKAGWGTQRRLAGGGAVAAAAAGRRDHCCRSLAALHRF